MNNFACSSSQPSHLYRAILQLKATFFRTLLDGMIQDKGT